ncbi:MAG: hypothetical protein IPN61_13175 [Bacteroidetes bacterium]|nr:hypothetical protein [Bacteroidota bacterium]MBK8364974.1 hypothetical protein [Bacteroidota bacterium]MBK9414341.1 hypothetical protein [Bacteroidota bacterium]
MKRCLDKALIERLINHLILTHVKDAEIQQLVENCKNWEEQIVIINYLLTQIIQKKIKKGSLPVSFLQELYDLIEEGDFVLDELDRNFIEFMFSHVRYSSDMNENIRQLKERHLEYDYRNTIRY